MVATVIDGKVTSTGVSQVRGHSVDKAQDRNRKHGYFKPFVALWAHLGSNQGPLACEASALPLSYAPGRA